MATFTGTGTDETITPDLVSPTVTSDGDPAPGAAADVLDGGGGDDVLAGGGGNDVIFGGAGDDRVIWNPGDGNDVVEGQADFDTLEFNGSAANETINILLNGTRALLLRDVASVTMDLNDVERIELVALGGADNIVVGNLSGTDVTEVSIDVGAGDATVDTVTASATNVADVFGVAGDAGGAISVSGLHAAIAIDGADGGDRLVLNALAGDDVVDASALAAGAISLSVNGGLGNDVIIGSGGHDLFIGGDGNDLVLMGAGDDRMVWNPGDDNDTLEGQAGVDTLQFNGANVAENISIAANGGRVTFFRDVANVTMDMNDVERIEFGALGGADTIVVNDLSGTDITEIVLGLAASGGSGDAQVDTILINGTAGDDVFSLSIEAGDLVVRGLAYETRIAGFETGDVVRIFGLGGNDVIDASALGAAAPAISFEGGGGDDVLLGGFNPDTLIGGDEDDVVVGNDGVDVLDGGLGDNIVIQDMAGPTAPGSAAVTVFGEAGADDALTLSRNAAGTILLNNGAISLPGAPNVATTGMLRIYGRAGNDILAVDETAGALPAAALHGGAGEDPLTGGAANDALFGGADDDLLAGAGGSDTLLAGSGDDTLIGGDGDDLMFGQAGNDRMIWNPGDDTDLMEGGAGSDTAEVNGGSGAEIFTTTANGTRVRFDRLDPAPFALDIGTTKSLVVDMSGGDDSFSTAGNLAALIAITVDGGDGNDTILGSNGTDLLIGGDGGDFVDGQQGNDVVLLGAGDDTFRWDPGDGNDVVEGQAGFDTMEFNGSAAAEIIAIAANGARTLFTRNVANIVMDLDGVERIEHLALGGADAITVDDLSATDVEEVEIALAASIGGSTGDAQTDFVTINGSAGADSASAGGDAALLTVAGLSAAVAISTIETQDVIRINLLGGNDVFAGAGASPSLIIDGGQGVDTIDFSSAVQPATIDLTAGLALGAGFGARTLVDFENAIGGGGADDLTGTEAENRLDGGGAADVMRGFGGNDDYIVDDAADVVVEGAGQGSDRVRAGVDYALDGDVHVELLTTILGSATTAINLTGNSLTQEIVGNLGRNVLTDGPAGGASDHLRGLSGDDVYRVFNAGSTIVESAAQGSSDRVMAAVDYTLAEGVHVELLTTILGSATDAIDLTGNSLAQEIIGNLGENTLTDGPQGGAADHLRGLSGNDVYRVFNSATTIGESSAQGDADRVIAAVDYELGAGVHVERLTTNAGGSTSPINLTGNELAQEIVGNAGVNVIVDGPQGGAADHLRGLSGSDTYRVFNSATTIGESSAQGDADRVIAAVDYKLGAGVHVERLTTNAGGSTSPINLTGNALAQEIVGNAGANVLHDGGVGAGDHLRGLSGNDTYRVFNADTTIAESASQGAADTVIAAVDYTLGVGVHVEALRTNAGMSTADRRLTGNELGQQIIGNNGDNRLEGKGGDDTLRGLGGNDTFVFADALGPDNVDTILDFDPVDDRFLMSNDIFSGFGDRTGAILPGHLRVNTTGEAQDASDMIIYDSDDGFLYYDADGFGAGEAIHFATIDPGLAVTNADFVLA